MKQTLYIISCTSLVFLVANTANSQENVPTDPRITHLTTKILERLPDAPYTRGALGSSDERAQRALAHAQAIVAAADFHQEQWTAISTRGNWQHFNVDRDLPALIAALAVRESGLHNVVRTDDNRRLTFIPHNVGRTDSGVMQIRAPSRLARACGIRTRAELQQMVSDINIGYRVGACVLTRTLERTIDRYSTPRGRHLIAGRRPGIELRFYGVWGPRRNTTEAALARELIVIERYNWGAANLYQSPRSGGYARRIIREFEFFRMPPETTPELMSLNSN
jgi:hypothetical protein